MSPTPSPRQSAQISVSSTSTPPRAASRYHVDNGFLVATTWIAGVLATAASILFGVWAPLSYKAAENANRDNNAAQSSMLSSVSVANSIAQAALSTASAQASLLEDAQSRLGAMGQLALYQFCATQTIVTVTSRFPRVSPPSSPPSRSAPASGVSPPSSPPSKSEASSGLSSLPIAAILGIVFGGVGVSGLVLGVLVWRYRKKRATQNERNESED